jgi:hypothetical protein
MNRISLGLLLLMVLVVAPGCYYYPPPPYAVTAPAHSNYDRIWDSAMMAAQDAGISITSSNRSTGTAYGHREGVTVTIQVAPQSDGTTRVELSAKGDKAATSEVNDRFYRAYNYYMGRR